MTQTPPRTLGFAIWSDNLALAKELLAEGAAVDQYGPSQDDFTPLMESFNEPPAFYDEVRIALTRLLLTNGADVARRDGAGRTALHYAAGAGPVAIQLLLAHGADIGARDDDGETALHAAIRRCNVAAAVALCAAGVDIAARNVDGITADDLVASTANVFTEHEIQSLKLAFEGP